MNDNDGDEYGDDTRVPYAGSLKARAKKAGKTPAMFAKANLGAQGDVGKLARLAYIADGVHGSGGDLSIPGAPGKVLNIG